MSIITQFPDAIVFPDGTIRLVTSAARLWTYTKTEIRSSCTASTVPDYIESEASVADAMEEAELTIKRERVPVGHYRSKRRRWPKSTTSSDGKVIQLSDYRTKEQRQVVAQRGYTHFQIRQHQRMQERDEKRKREEARQDEQTIE